MPATRWQAGRLADEVALLATRALPREEYFRELTARLRRTIDVDAACWHTLDPETLLMTSDASEDLVTSGVYTAEEAQAAGVGIIASEYLSADVNSFATLARRRVPASTLSAATRGRLEKSARYRDVLEPTGIPHELRGAFASRGRTWGAVHLARTEGQPDFNGRDVKALARIAPAVADGIRASLRFDAARRGETGPGMIVLGPRDEVELMTAPVRELLTELQRASSSEETIPSALLAVAHSARVAKRACTVAVPGRNGWMTVHASLPEGHAGGRVAIVIDRAAGAQSTALRLETYGVTAREREVAALIAQGCSNAEIAAALVISPYTVQDHIKSLFEKTGVNARRELVARIFLDDYLPQLMVHAPLTSSGGFAA
jgi:DNA-binding CsgD family transcriptional regulator/GAF domain-containing protein